MKKTLTKVIKNKCYFDEIIIFVSYHMKWGFQTHVHI